MKTLQTNGFISKMYKIVLRIYSLLSGVIQILQWGIKTLGLSLAMDKRPGQWIRKVISKAIAYDSIECVGNI